MGVCCCGAANCPEEHDEVQPSPSRIGPGRGTGPPGVIWCADTDGSGADGVLRERMHQVKPLGLPFIGPPKMRVSLIPLGLPVGALHEFRAGRTLDCKNAILPRGCARPCHAADGLTLRCAQCQKHHTFLEPLVARSAIGSQNLRPSASIAARFPTHSLPRRQTKNLANLATSGRPLRAAPPLAHLTAIRSS